MQFSAYGQNVLALLERSSRWLIGHMPLNKTAPLIADTIEAIMAALPLPLRKTITFDNGTEFAHHARLHAINLNTFFCNTHSPWQKGAIENAIGRLRRFLPRKTNLTAISEDDFNAFLARYDNTPRTCLDYRNPAEVFCQQLLHFKCESTPKAAAATAFGSGTALDLNGNATLDLSASPLHSVHTLAPPPPTSRTAAPPPQPLPREETTQARPSTVSSRMGRASSISPRLAAAP